VATVRSKPNQRFLRNVTELHVAASFCLARIALLLLQQEDVDADSKDEGVQTPLSAYGEALPLCNVINNMDRKRGEK